MGCDIHVMGEKCVNGIWVEVPEVALVEQLTYRAYGTFAFLAGVRNYSDIQPISKPRGLPDDASSEVKQYFDEWGYDIHSTSWLSLDELERFDYSTQCEDRRCIRRLPGHIYDGAATCDPGDGRMMTFREFLGESFFCALTELRRLGVERIVFGFDN